MQKLPDREVTDDWSHAPNWTADGTALVSSSSNIFILFYCAMTRSSYIQHVNFAYKEVNYHSSVFLSPFLYLYILPYDP